MENPSYSLIKKWYSYVFPILIEKTEDDIGNELLLYLHKGKIKLYTQDTNYSGGELKSVFRKALANEKFTETNHILILGFGLGSIWEILKEEHQFKGQITGVELNSTIVKWARFYTPNLDADTKTNICQVGAQYFLNNNKTTFSHIFIDLFENNNVCPFIWSHTFWNSIHKSIKKNGLVVINTINPSKDALTHIENYFYIKKTITLNKHNYFYFLSPRIFDKQSQ
jgi:predicted membrane-bound spermidine synthase